MLAEDHRDKRLGFSQSSPRGQNPSLHDCDVLSTILRIIQVGRFNLTALE